MLWYTLILVLARTWIPEPGPVADFEKRKRIREYHTYYLQYPSLCHAITSLILSKCFNTHLCVAPVVWWVGGYRYNQPNELWQRMMVAHSVSYFLYDQLAEMYFGASDMLTNFHHAAALMVGGSGLISHHTCFEYLCKWPILNNIS